MAYRVMLADDEPIMRKALLTLADWEKMECEVVYVASNGNEVLENLHNVTPDILITDIRMPGKSGIDLAEYIWEKNLPIKVIILTAYADFSYAQSALKYKVVDYVVKAGALDGLSEAVEKAKEGLAKEREYLEERKEPHVENFLKSVFDGSMYEEREIQEASERTHFILKDKEYIVILLRFKVRDEKKIRGGKTLYDSLKNFFSMVFGKQLLGEVAVERDTFALVLSYEKEQFERDTLFQCRQIIDMMDNFMKLYGYIGIGKGHKEAKELKEAYNEAQEALENSFIDEESKINIYDETGWKGEVVSNDEQMKKLCAEIQKGDLEGTKAQFAELIQMQKTSNCSSHSIKNSGIYIQSQCRMILKEYGKTIYEVTGLEKSISKTIYQCRFLKEFEEIMEIIVLKTASEVNMMANKKKLLICGIEKFIEDNFAKNILVTDVAKYVGTSPSYLSRVYKEMTGQTIIHTINQKKLEKAKEYLEHTDMKVYEIAEAAGFENTTYFSHFFKKYVGVSPKDYKGGN